MAKLPQEQRTRTRVGMRNKLMRYGIPYGVAVVLLALMVAGCRATPPAQRTRPVGRPVPASPSSICPPDGTTAAPVPEAAPAWRPVAGRTVVLDPGHGGRDEGTSHFGLREKDINLDLARRTADELQSRGVRVILTRNSDVFLPLADRSAVANRNPSAPFVSIHVNAAPANPNAAGVETFVLSGELSNEERGRVIATRYKANGSDPVAGRQALASLAVKSRGESPALARAVQRSVAGRLGDPDRGVKPGNLAVLRETYFGPAVLVEVGFLTHARTAERMRTEEWRRRTAEAICEGICDYLRQPE